MDDRFASKDGRIKRYEELRDLLAAVFATRTREDWLAALAAADVPAAPILDLEEALESAQVQAIDIVASHAPDGSAVPANAGLVKLPVAVDAQFYQAPTAPPQLGEHTDEILAGLGLSSQEVAELRDDQAVR